MSVLLTLFWLRSLFKSMVLLDLSGWEAVELTKESCIHLFVRRPQPDMGATIVAAIFYILNAVYCLS